MAKQPTDLMKVAIHVAFERQVALIAVWGEPLVKTIFDRIFSGRNEIGFVLRNLHNLDPDVYPGFHRTYYLAPSEVGFRDSTPLNVYVEIGLADSMELFDPSEVATDYDTTPFKECERGETFSDLALVHGQPNDLMKAVLRFAFERQMTNDDKPFVQDIANKMFSVDKMYPVAKFYSNWDMTKVAFMLKCIVGLDSPGFHENYYLPSSAFPRPPALAGYPPFPPPLPGVEPAEPEPFNVYVEIGMTDSMELFDPSEVTTEYDTTPFGP